MTGTERRETLARYAQRVLELDVTPTLPLPRSADYDDRMQAKADGCRGG
jgi:hypothetical protein